MKSVKIFKQFSGNFKDFLKTLIENFSAFNAFAYPQKFM